ncbi:hypothetical protein AwWohl_10450 [Gammaproteobacteria bacterium]|nr:hypothetical protein AwWohl_10450 [Gammaproteobacteria bacterium]
MLMMEMSEEAMPIYKTIRKYAVNYFKTQDSEYHGPILLFKETVFEADLFPKDPADLNESHFRQWLDLGPELILLGCGDKQFFLSPPQQHFFIQNKTPIDTMSTPAACRTFNILMSEERLAMAVLYPILLNN